jgi:hypothetical protein
VDSVKGIDVSTALPWKLLALGATFFSFLTPFARFAGLLWKGYGCGPCGP